MGRKKEEKKNKIKYTMRLEKEVYEKLRKLAREERRSMNQEVIYIMKACVRRYEKKKGEIREEEQKER